MLAQVWGLQCPSLPVGAPPCLALNKVSITLRATGAALPPPRSIGGCAGLVAFWDGIWRVRGASSLQSSLLLPSARHVGEGTLLTAHLPSSAQLCLSSTGVEQVEAG